MAPMANTGRRAAAGARVLRAGITGHRPDGIAAADPHRLRAQVRAVLADVARAGDAPPRVVASLAEGADRLAVTEALALGFRLTAVLPFPRAEFARDFATARSRAEYAALVASADEVVELPGLRDDTGHGAAYAAANEAILGRSDLLIAVWDGEPAGGLGGTATVVRRALDLGLPVVQIESAAPHAIRVPDAAGGAERPLLATSPPTSPPSWTPADRHSRDSGDPFRQCATKPGSSRTAQSPMPTAPPLAASSDAPKTAVAADASAAVALVRVTAALARIRSRPHELRARPTACVDRRPVHQVRRETTAPLGQQVPEFGTGAGSVSGLNVYSRPAQTAPAP